MMIECECRIELADHRIIHCPKHAAADDLLETLQAIGDYQSWYPPPDPTKVSLFMGQIARAAIVRATKESE